ncbi:BrnA antitoxin family protein [Methylobacterium sp. WL69]|nr:BrnA antitoxin family protein [Methylobacterium sp. WL69]TXM75105.1 BrnA antitoxin family protein [Methylobacterium sp. WL69]
MPSHKKAEPLPDRTDWAALRAMSDNEIERIAADDEDNPATDESHWVNATVILPSGKTSIHASFDRDVVDFFKRDGRGYQARMNAVLRHHMEAQQGKTSRS